MGDANLLLRSCTKTVKLEVMIPSFILTLVPCRSVEFLVPVYASLGEFSGTNYSLRFHGWVRTLLGAMTFNYLTCLCAEGSCPSTSYLALNISSKNKNGVSVYVRWHTERIKSKCFLGGWTHSQEISEMQISLDIWWLCLRTLDRSPCFVPKRAPDSDVHLPPPPKMQSLPSDLRAWRLRSCDSWQDLPPLPPLSQDTFPFLTSCKCRYMLSGSQRCTVPNTMREIV